ncbi:17204_t:CDS:2, partial [Gigaspora rosea]
AFSASNALTTALSLPNLTVCCLSITLEFTTTISDLFGSEYAPKEWISEELYKEIMSPIQEAE